MADQNRRTPALTRRSVLAGGAGLGLGALLAACSSDDAAATGSSAAAGNASKGATDSFPVTIEHVYGSTTIEAEPTKIATVSWTNDDVVIALGVVPVGVPTVSWGADENGSYPWTTDALEALGAGWDTDKAPKQYSETDGINVQEIAALEPDLIIGTYSGMTEDEYTQLSAIAPTIAYPKGVAAYGTPWETTTKDIGQALGRSAAAEELVTKTTEAIQTAAGTYPELRSKTYIAANLDATSSTINLYTKADNRPRLFDMLGMTMAPAAADGGADTEDEFFVEYSAEKADALTSDLFWSWANDEAAVKAVEANELLSTIPAVKDGTALFVTDNTTVMSLSAASPLSLPWCCENHVPQIAAAVTGGSASATASATATTAS
ncbi:ABC transporter substrate-binding protein [Actinomyces radicidentis]|uniref:ABC transporter substrate-binding protein n=1 Tax=Actinomyces radicidentis TaxID=111015 RepID=UPI0026DEBACC|nr:ABC transporter substrate-binding protein [Actinomyces radicidentis]